MIAQPLPQQSIPASPPAVSHDRFAGTTAGEAKEIVPGMNFHWCAASSFMMGKTEESPVEVTLSHGFWMAETELTQGQWVRLIGTTPWNDQNVVTGGDDLPAIHVSYDDAIDYCEKLTAAERKEGRLPSSWKFQLPTEAQWEFACRAGTKTRFSFGDDESLLTEYAWCQKNDANVGPRPVGKKEPNGWGLRDMHGNVWEWCLDFYAAKLPGGLDPINVGSGTNRVMRGCCYFNAPSYCNAATRGGISPASRFNYLGFRVAAVSSND